MDKPTIYVTNWSSRKLHGPGRKLTIMRRPRSWEHGEGRVEALTPSGVDLDLVGQGTITTEQYNARCEARFRAFPLEPGELGALRLGLVADGDTLCCACSREAAANGCCHRVVAARLLKEAGWNVVLDGVVL